MTNMLKNRKRMVFLPNVSGKIVFYVTFLMLLTYSYTGCSKPTTSGVSVYGTVTLDGIPLENGDIAFFEKNTDQSFSSVIHNGKYQLNALPGEKTIRITGTKPGKTVPRNDFPGDTAMDTVYESIVPEKYNTKTTLSCTVGQNGGEQNFELLSK